MDQKRCRHKYTLSITVHGDVGSHGAELCVACHAYKYDGGKRWLHPKVWRGKRVCPCPLMQSDREG